MTAAPQIGRTYRVAHKLDPDRVRSDARFRVVWQEFTDGRHMVGVVRVMQGQEAGEARFVAQEFDWYLEGKDE